MLRFIEYMDVGATNGWRMDEVLPSAEVVQLIAARIAAGASWSRARPAKPPSAGAMRDGGGEIGVICSVTQAFCGDCNRARLSTEGKLYLCLFASHGHDLRALLRGGAERRRRLASAIGQIWHGRADRYSRAARPHAARQRHRRRAAGRDELHRRLMP